MWPAYDKMIQLKKYRMCPVYRPADGDQIPSYFYSMLDDIDRTLKYANAIQNCLEKIPDPPSPGPPFPIVIDVGVGTGLLSSLVLHFKRNAIVFGVDVNKSALDSANKTMKELGYENRFHGLLVTTNSKTSNILDQVNKEIGGSFDMTDNPPFNMIISEILGTLVYGESMDIHLKKYMPLVKKYNGKVFAIPQICKQYFSIYKINVHTALKNVIEVALDKAASLKHYLPTDKGGIGIALHLYESTCLLKDSNTLKRERAVIYEKDYTNYDYNIIVNKSCKITGKSAFVHSRKSSDSESEPMLIFDDDETNDDEIKIGVFEWECILWDDRILWDDNIISTTGYSQVILSNTMMEYKKIAYKYGQRYAFARQNAWGFMICNLNNINKIKVSYTKKNGTELELISKNQTPTIKLEDVSDNMFSWISSAADIILVEKLYNIIEQNITNTENTVIHIIDDTTYGNLANKLVYKFDKIKIEISNKFLSNDSIEAINRTCKDDRINVFQSRGKRLLLKDRKPTLIICPYLCYMHKKYTNYMNQYKCIAQQMITNLIIPNTLVTTKYTNIKIKTISGIVKLPLAATAIPQMIKNHKFQFTTRDFHSIPFLRISYDSSHVEYEFDLKISDFECDDPELPTATFHNIETMIVTGNIHNNNAKYIEDSSAATTNDNGGCTSQPPAQSGPKSLDEYRNESREAEKYYASALARMISGDGLTCLINHVGDYNESNSEDDEDSDDSYKPCKERKR